MATEKHLDIERLIHELSTVLAGVVNTEITCPKDSLLNDEMGLEIQCPRPYVKNIIELVGYDFILETLELDTDIFEKILGTYTFSAELRHEMTVWLKTHVAECSQCRATAERVDKEERQILDALAQAVEWSVVWASESIHTQQRPTYPDRQKKQGKVRWFNKAKGYSFIEQPEGEDDIFVHYSVIQGQGFESLDKGEIVEFELVQEPKGQAAEKVTKLK
jgi:cold shock protein